MRLIIILIFITTGFVNGQMPKTGTYTYNIAFEEWGGKSNGATCTVIIKGDSIKVIYNGVGNLTAKKGDVLDEGIIMRHKKTGKYIIARNIQDQNTDEANGCEGPSVIDFARKKFWIC